MYCFIAENCKLVYTIKIHQYITFKIVSPINNERQKKLPKLPEYLKLQFLKVKGGYSQMLSALKTLIKMFIFKIFYLV